MQNDTREQRAVTATLRWMANLLRLSHFCVQSACRRAGTCCRNPRGCMTRLTPLIPDDVRDGVDVLLDARFFGLSYEEARKAAPFEVAAYEGWLARVRESAASPSPPAAPLCPLPRRRRRRRHI
jgi:hypothetical protein